MQEQTEPTAPAPEANEPQAPSVIPFSETNVSTRYEDVYEDRIPNSVSAVRWHAGAYEFACESGVHLRVQFLTPTLLRLRYSPDGEWERDFSYALHPEFTPDKLTVRLSETNTEYLLMSDELQVVVPKQGLRVRIFNQDDVLVYEDSTGFTARRTIMEGWNRVALGMSCHKKAHFYGLGDKASPGASIGKRNWSNWCTDSYAFGEDSDAMYRAIPFFYVLQNERAFGVFLDNTYKTHIDLEQVAEGHFEMWAEGGELNYYFLYGPQLDAVAKQYHRLTGVPALPPMWSIGYHQCRWSYYPEAQVKALADLFRQHQIPCDAIYLDIDYMDGYRCFTWDTAHFPDPARLSAEMREMGFRLVTMIDPGIKEDTAYEVYADGIRQGFFVKTADGKVAKAPVWPGFCAFPDFTEPRVRQWWGEWYREMYEKMGISGFWNDMNEPAVFYVTHKTLPDQVIHHFDGDPCSHKKAHNVYGMQMTRATYEGLLAIKTEQRPFLLTRATYSGGQRYAAVWTGDNCATWEHLQIANIQCQRLAISGFSFCGTDIGGFSGETEPELYLRWLQLAVFHPLMRTHSIGEHLTGDAIYNVEPGDAPEEKTEPVYEFGQEPWSYGEKWTELTRTAIELRYCLLPALYTAFWRLYQEGIPIIRHLAFADQKDPRLLDHDRDFLFADHLLVSPVIAPKVQRQMVSLPSGNWYYFWNGQLCHREVFINVTNDQIPFFVKEGAVLPTYPVRQHTGQAIEEVTLYCYYKNGTETSYWYEDEGDGMGYQQENFQLSTLKSVGDAQSYTMNWLKSGNWSPVSRKIKIYLVGFPTFAKKCLIDRVEMPVKEIRLRDKSLYTLTTETDFSTISWHA